MGKEGPCCHCGVASTPLWRNGPPEKPVLCNACGSRWRTKGKLEDYIPLHARTFQLLDTEDSHNFQECKIPFRTKKKKLCKSARIEGYRKGKEVFVGYDRCPTGFEDDTSNRYSSESAISCSESYLQLGSMDGNGISGSVQSNFWDFHIPTKKRSRTGHYSSSPIEKLRRNLVDILREQESSHLTGYSEEVLIFEKKDSWLSAEIGLGGILIKTSLSFNGEEPEARSLVMENNVSYLNGYVESSCLSLQSKSSEFSMNQESNRLKQETGDAKELKVDVPKQSAFTIKYSGNTLLSNPGKESNRWYQKTGDAEGLEVDVPKQSAFTNKYSNPGQESNRWNQESRDAEELKVDFPNQSAFTIKYSRNTFLSNPGKDSNRWYQKTVDAERLKVGVLKQSAFINKYSGNTLLSNPGQESNRWYQKTRDVEELKVDVPKQSAFTNKYSGNTLFSNTGILQSTHSPHMQINCKPNNVESCTPMNEMTGTTSCLSRLIGGGLSLPAERSLDLPYLPTFRGPRFQPIESFRRPNDRLVLHYSSSSISMSAISIGGNSSQLPFREFPVETSYNGIRMRGYPGIPFPVYRLPSAPVLQIEANKEETNLDAQIFQQPFYRRMY